MAKDTSRNNDAIFDDIDSYLNFCREYGYKFDEADLYSQRSYAYRQYCKFMTGKPAKNMWYIDGKPSAH